MLAKITSVKIELPIMITGSANSFESLNQMVKVLPSSPFRNKGQRRAAESDGSALQRFLWSCDPGELHQPHPALRMHVQ